MRLTSDAEGNVPPIAWAAYAVFLTIDLYLGLHGISGANRYVLAVGIFVVSGLALASALKAGEFSRRNAVAATLPVCLAFSPVLWTGSIGDATQSTLAAATAGSPQDGEATPVATAATRDTNSLRTDLIDEDRQLRTKEPLPEGTQAKLIIDSEGKVVALKWSAQDGGGTMRCGLVSTGMTEDAVERLYDTLRRRLDRKLPGDRCNA